MKDKTIRNIRLCCYIALLFCVIWAVLMIVHFIQLFDGKEFLDWANNLLLIIGFFLAYVISSFFCVLLCIKFVLNTFKGLRDNTPFPKSNVRLLFWLALALFVYLLCWINEPVLFNAILFRFVSINILIPFFILFFAFMYKVAADAVEENNLTI